MRLLGVDCQDQGDVVTHPLRKRGRYRESGNATEQVPPGQIQSEFLVELSRTTHEILFMTSLISCN